MHRKYSFLGSVLLLREENGIFAEYTLGRSVCLVLVCAWRGREQQAVDNILALLKRSLSI